MTADKHTRTTFFMNEYDSFRSAESDDECINSKNYQHKIDKFMYAAIHIRSDIVFTIKRFNQYFSDSTIYHKQALMILLRYVRFIIDLDIVYKIESNVNKNLNNSESFKLKAFSDLNYAVDRPNKKSILEYIYMFAEESIA